jgi:galactose oxidase
MSTAWKMSSNRSYGSNVLLPITPGGVLKDYVMATGGLEWNPSPGTILDSVQACNASASPNNHLWFPLPALGQARWLHQTVLLPDSTVLVLGGERVHDRVSCSRQPALLTEQLVAGSPSWTPLAPDTIVRDYHATALLLPSGKVLTGGGESRHRGPCTSCSPNVDGCYSPATDADYRVFDPPNVCTSNARPQILGLAAPGSAWTWGHGTVQSVAFSSLPFGVSVQKAVLMRAGSVTHHSDGKQRCVELGFQLVPDSDPPAGFSLLNATVPTRLSQLLPRGYYMLFLVTSQGALSMSSTWVRIQ